MANPQYEYALALKDYVAIDSNSKLLNSRDPQVRTAAAKLITLDLTDFENTFSEESLRFFSGDLKVLKERCLEVLSSG